MIVQSCWQLLNSSQAPVIQNDYYSTQSPEPVTVRTYAACRCEDGSWMHIFWEYVQIFIEKREHFLKENVQLMSCVIWMIWDVPRKKSAVYSVYLFITCTHCTYNRGYAKAQNLCMYHIWELNNNNNILLCSTLNFRYILSPIYCFVVVHQVLYYGLTYLYLLITLQIICIIIVQLSK